MTKNENEQLSIEETIRSLNTFQENQFHKVLEDFMENLHKSSGKQTEIIMLQIRAIRSIDAIHETHFHNISETLIEASNKQAEETLSVIEAIHKNQSIEFQKVLHGIRHKSDDKRKEFVGGFVMFVWLGAGGVLFWTNENAIILSWQATAYFILGTLIAIGTLGPLFYTVSNGISSLLASDFLIRLAHRFTHGTTGESIFRNLYRLAVVSAWALFVIFAASTYLIADFTVSNLFSPPLPQ